MSLTRVQWYLVEKCAALLHLLGSAGRRQGGQKAALPINRNNFLVGESLLPVRRCYDLHATTIAVDAGLARVPEAKAPSPSSLKKEPL